MGAGVHGERCRDRTLGSERSRNQLGTQRSSPRLGEQLCEGLPGLVHSKARDRLDPDAVIGEI